jgi:glucose-6-phosphate isomerase
MTDIFFSYEYTHASTLQIAQQHERLLSSIIAVRTEQSQMYESMYASLYCPFDATIFQHISHLKTYYQHRDSVAVVVIGIGGSAMATRALARALNKQLIFLETVDVDESLRVCDQIRELLQSGKKIVVNVVTKSGTTTETIVNFQLVLSLLQQYFPDSYHEYVVVTTDTGSPLESVARSQNFHILSVPPRVGGRFSVFSAVALFPLALVGVDIEQLRAGAQAGFKESVSDDIAHNNAAYSACVKFLAYQNGITLFDMFIFSLACSDIGFWYRQLFAESLGKKYDRHGALVEVGMVPTVSIGSTDLHSIAQRYLGGARSIFTTFIDVENKNTAVHTPHSSLFESCVNHVQDRPVADVMRAIFSGTQHAYAVDHRPFISITIPEKNEFWCGKFLQLCMHEVVYLAHLLDVNAFDQPDVEAYKKETRRLLQS